MTVRFAELEHTNGHALPVMAGDSVPPHGSPGFEPPAVQLLLWLRAAGIKPAEGWYRAIGVNDPEVAGICSANAGELQRIRLLRTAARLLGPEEISLMLRAQLAEKLAATSPSTSDLANCQRLLEKLEPLAGGEEPVDDLELHRAVADAREIIARWESNGLI